MIYEFKGVCRHCATEVSMLIHNGRVVGKCPDCTNEPFELSTMQGIVYVVTNPHQSGVKVGITTKTVEERIKGLNSTGVAGSFRPVAIFPSKSPKKHEKKVHDRLTKVRIEKEHFNLDPIDAVLKVYRILNKSITPIFYSDEDQDTFNKRLELDRITMELKLKGKKVK
jgi:hypothetical protein